MFRSVFTLATFLSLAAACGGADEPRAGDVDATPAPDASADAAGPSTGCPGARHVIYLNRAGGTYRAGANDSSVNTAGYLTTDATFPAWTGSDASFAQVQACLVRNFARYDVGFVTADPGAAEHVEVVLADSIAPARLGAGITGIAPASADCSPIYRGIVLYDAHVYGETPDPLAYLCDDVSRSIANALGLDNVLNDRNIMSWLHGRDLATRSFTDTADMCGEAEARACRCGGTTQAAHGLLLARLGACAR